MKKKCKYDKLLSSYIDEEMSPEDADRLGHHLKTCSLCSKEIESLRSTDQFIADLPVIEPSAGFDRSFWDKVSDLQHKKRGRTLPAFLSFIRRPYYYASALTIILIIALMVFLYQTNTPNDDEAIAKNLDLLMEYEIIDNLDLFENWNTIIMMNEKS